MNDAQIHHFLGLDIGGSEIKAALVNQRGAVLESHHAPTPASLNQFRAVLHTLVGALQPKDAAFRGIGIGCKGIIDQDTSRVLVLPGHLNYLEGLLLSELITPALSRPCLIAADNDARVVLAGERAWGGARKCQTVLLLTLGTGVGGAILSDGTILRGAGGIAGHLGHLTVDPDGEECICGNRGCLETVFSAHAIESAAFAAIHRGVRSSLLEYGSRPPTCAEVFACARKGDEPALYIIRRAARVLGAAIAGLAHVFDPEVVILSGQMVESGDLLVDIVRNEVG
ncbi:MAG: ROK family protein, partial [Candidatus Dormibacteraceae bacterium]